MAITYKIKPAAKRSQSKASAEPLPFSIHEPGHKVRKTHLMSLFNIGRDTVFDQVRTKDIPPADGKDRQGYFWMSEHINAVIRVGETPEQRTRRIRGQDRVHSKTIQERNKGKPAAPTQTTPEMIAEIEALSCAEDAINLAQKIAKKLKA
jgi:hypothetical protein